MLPVPAPATVELLKSIPVKTSNIPFEATTPTGAAILAVTANEFTDSREFKILRTGYGVGGKKIGEIPNLLRVYLSEDNNKYLDTGYETRHNNSDIFVVECNIDDMNPEIYDYVMKKLFNIGALDVFMTPIIMKKQRPAVMLTVIVTGEKVSTVENTLLSETTTLGIRRYKVDRRILSRDSRCITTVYGDVKVKICKLNDERVKYKAEYDDCKKIALEKDIPISDVYREVDKEIYKNSILK